MTLFAVFDVESVGLHGEGFAVGGVVITDSGEFIGSSLYAACPPDHAHGDHEGREWLRENLPPLTWTHDDPRGVRDAFWGWWMENKARGALLAADCAWPVEARFLARCIDDKWREPPPHARDWLGPYPLIDVASVRLAAGLDPLATEPRLDNEQPAHNPRADAQQSARLLVEALAMTGMALDSHEAMHG